MKKKIKSYLVSAIFVLALSLSATAQIKYSGKLEAGYLNFRHNTIQVEAGPNWKGYNLDNNQNGIEINLVNGISFFNEKAFAGIGVGYLNFEGVHGFSAFSDFEYLPLKSRLTPLLNLKIGYTHIWNQYDGGTGTALLVGTIGLNYKLNEKLHVFIKSGLYATQQAFLVPIQFGMRI